MPDNFQNTISTPDLPNFKASIRPFLKMRFIRVQNSIDYGTHSDHADAFLPTGVAQLMRTIDLDFERIIPMPECIKRTTQREFSEYSPEGVSLREENSSNFGFKDWYDWSWKHWGTKWNSYHGGFRNNDTAFLFCTAWCAPKPVLKQLAELLNTTIKHEYFDYEIEGIALFHPGGAVEDTRRECAE